MIYPPSLVRLIEALRCLPGVGPKSAQRMAFHLLEKDRNAAGLLAFADGAIVGSSLKVDGVTWNPVDKARVEALMTEVRSASAA